MRLGVICLILAITFWSSTPVFIKHFSLANVDGHVQNLFRYIAAATGIWLFVLVRFRREALQAWRKWYIFLLPTFFNCVFQVTLVSSLYKKSIYPGFMSLLQKSTVVFSVVLAFVIFTDERRTILSWRYLAGCGLAAAGVVGVVMFGESASADFREGVVIILTSAFLWSCYTLAMKRVVKDTRPVICFAMVSAYTTVFFVVLTFLRSDPAQFFTLTPTNKVLLVLSGLLCISVAHSVYFRAVERLGVAICASTLLVTPLTTGIIEAFRFGRLRLNVCQMLMGAVLLAGTYLVVIAGRRRRNVPPAHAEPQPPDLQEEP